jgi:hypothetical protein
MPCFVTLSQSELQWLEAVQKIRERRLTVTHVDFGPTLAVEKLMEWHRVSVSKEKLRRWMTERGFGRHIANVDGDCINRAVGAIASSNWFKSMARITCGLRTPVRSAPCSFISMDGTGKLLHLRFAVSENTFDYFHVTRRILRNGASQSPFTVTSMAYSAPPIRQRRTAILA